MRRFVGRGCGLCCCCEPLSGLLGPSMCPAFLTSRIWVSMERCSDRGEDQGAEEEAFMGQKKAKNHHVSFGKSRLARAALLSARVRVQVRVS